MYTFEQLSKIIEKSISNIQYPAAPAELYSPIKYALENGGKRIRPVLTLMACNIFSDDVTQAVKPAVGLEIFHNFTLVHDDIMDNSPLRRGKLSVHSKWNSNSAILSGDAMAFLAQDFFFDLPGDIISVVLRLFNKTAVQICEGQQYDINFETSDYVDIDDYLLMIKLKTAVLPAACLKIGALIGGASFDKADMFYQAGINLGLAFQLQDDLLDIYSTDKVLGKPIGGDIIENKKTLLMIKTLESLNSVQRKDFQNYILDKNIDREEKISYVTDVYNRFKVKDFCDEKINACFDEALKNIANACIESRSSQLIDYFNKIRSRNK